MNNTLLEIGAPVTMKLQQDWFRPGYYVYIVLVKHNEKRYHYIGMTGDRKHLVARSPFYRMGGHFMLGKSTQNQVIKGIEEKLGINVKEDSSLLCDMDFTYYAWMIKPYDKNIQKEEHAIKRTIAEKIEAGLISKCKVEFGLENVFNKRGSRKDSREYVNEVEAIFKQLQKL